VLLLVNVLNIGKFTVRVTENCVECTLVCQCLSIGTHDVTHTKKRTNKQI